MNRPAPTPRIRLVCLLLCTALCAHPGLFGPAHAYVAAGGRNAVGEAAAGGPLANAAAPTATRAGRAPARQAEGHDGRLLVRFKGGVSPEEADSLAATYNLIRQGRLRGASGFERMSLGAGQTLEAVLPALKTNASIESAEPDYVITADQISPNDPRFGEQWSLAGARGAEKSSGAGVSALDAWQRTIGSRSTVIAVIDSGIDFTHPDLRENRWSNAAALSPGKVDLSDLVSGENRAARDYVGDAHGWDWIGNTGALKDEGGHGTAVAGVIAAEGDNFEGVTGVMWRASLMSLRVLDAEGRGRVSDAVEAIDYAVAHGAQVVNCSWGTDDSSEALKQALERAVAGGVTVVASAGNGGRDLGDAPRYPAAFGLAGVIAVAAAGEKGELAKTSNRGAGHVALAAPGEGLLTTKAGGDYAPASGTSVAAAVVSGIAGLVRTLRPHLGAARTEELIVRGARRVRALKGRVRAGGVADAAGALGALAQLPPGEGLGDGASEGEGKGEGAGGAADAKNVAGIDAARSLRVTPHAPPGGGMSNDFPDLDKARRSRPDSPRAIKPVPSTRRRCPPQNPRCNDDLDGADKPATKPAPTPTPAPSVSTVWGSGNASHALASLNAPPLHALLRAAMNGRGPAVSVSLLDYYGEGGGHAVSDSPPPAPFPAAFAARSAMLYQAAPGRMNVALASNGGVATASSTYTSSVYPAGSFPPGAAINGDRRGLNWGSGGGWHGAAQNNFPDWLQVDFRGSKVIDEIDVFTIQDAAASPSEPTEAMTFSLYGTTGYSVQYWNGAGWVTVPSGTVAGNNKVWRKFTFAPVLTSRIRVLVNAAVDGYTRLIEVEAYEAAEGSAYSAAANFSATQNPTGPWSYGYRANPISPFVAYGSTAVLFGAGSSSWSTGVGCCPSVSRNNTGVNYTYPNATSVVQPPDMLNLHPGPNGERSYVRWIAPAAATYLVEGRFRGIDNSATTSDVAVAHNGANAFAANVNGYATTAPFSFMRTLAAGDWIDFSVGYGSNANYSNDSTGLAATITATQASLVAHWKFDEGGGSAAADAAGNANTGTLVGPAWVAGHSGPGALDFDGGTDRITVPNSASIGAVSNNFTMAFWVNPRATHEIDPEGNTGVAGTGGQRYAWGPNNLGTADAGAGISVGTNGVSVYEHGPGYMPATLVHQAALSGWTHVAVVYENRRPTLYLNGVAVRTGATSAKAVVTARPADLGGMVYGYLDGQMDDVRLYAGALSPAEVAALTEATGAGLTGRYYDNVDFTNYKATRVDPTVDFWWDLAAPHPLVGAEEFSVRWTGMIVPRYSETYTFYTTNDDGVRLWIDGQLIIDKWIDQGATEWTGQIALTAGRAYSVRLEFYDRFWGAVSKLAWSSPSQAKEIVPQSRLMPCWKSTEQFVRDSYQSSVNRQPNPFELQAWVGQLAQAQGETQLVSVAQSLSRTLFNSQEYAARARSNHDFVGDLYWGTLQRAPDASGWAFWEGQVGSNGRPPTVEAFVQSGEFRDKVLRLCGTAAAADANSGAGYNFSTAMLEPGNRTGGEGVDPLSRNASWSIPILNLPGRAALDLGLSLSYNSLVWTKDGGGITFDADRGTPSPGFRLGFPTVLPKFFNPRTQKNAYLLVAPSGARVELRQTAPNSSVYEAADSSYLQLTESGGELALVSTDGTRLSLFQINGEYKCYRVRDRNGNYISVNYTQFGQISSVVDTLGRTINFTYDSYDNLIEIWQDWKRETAAAPAGVNERHVWATFGYQLLQLQPSFSNLAVVGTPPGALIPVLSQVGLDDGSYYKFNYNQWGQVWKVTQFAADSVVGGVPQDTHPLTYTRFNLPGSDLTGATAQSDCPRFTEQRIWIENGVGGASAELTTSYSNWAPDLASCNISTPDGNTVKQFYETAGWRRGQTYRSEVSSAGVLRKWTTVTTEHDGGEAATYPTNTRLTLARVEDAQGNHRRTEFSYGAYGLTTEIRDYNANDAVPLRASKFAYDLNAEYTSRRIIGLPLAEEVYAGAVSPANLRSKLSYVYDDTTVAGYLQALPSAASQHDAANYGVGFRWRGNVNRMRRHEVNQQTGAAGGSFTEGQAGYNVAGGVVVTRNARGRQTTFGYADSFFQSVNRTHANPALQLQTFAYPTLITDPDLYTAATSYNYDMGVATQTQTPQPNTTANQPGPVERMLYDAAGRILRVSNSVNAAHSEWVYPLSQTIVQTFTTVSDESLTNAARRAYAATVLDGAGRVRGEAADLPVEGATGRYVGRRVLYDAAGRVEYQSNPTEMTTTNGVWTPAGDDANNGVWRWTHQLYDWQGRPTTTTYPDGAQQINEYVGCGCAGVQTMTIRDEVGRRQKVYNDALGRPWKTEHLDLSQNVYRTMTNVLDIFGRATEMTERKGTAGASQTTTTDFDGYGRVWKVKTPQALAPSVTEYFADDAVWKKTDARGATATFTYNNRGLATFVDYNAPAGVGAAADVTYTYDAAGNRLSMIDGVGNVSYSYDALSRLAWESRQFGLVSNPSATDGRYKLTYAYTAAGALTGITDPFGASVSYGFDDVGRVTGVGGSSFGGVTSYTSGMKYRAWGAVKKASYGDGMTLDVTYDVRLNPASYDYKNSAGTRVMGASYQYYDDGRLRFVDDLREDRFDRLYEYDHVGRASKAETGYRARQVPYPGNNSQNGPYNHYYAYDEFNNLTSRTGHYWYRESGETFTATYLNNRNQNTGWQYDSDGRLTRSEVLTSSSTTPVVSNYTYDAAGQRTDAGQYDGDGRRVKPSDNKRYFVRSTALGGLPVTEVESETHATVSLRGSKGSTFVYLGGEAIAEQYISLTSGSPTQQIKWMREDPAKTSTHERDPHRMPAAQAGGVQLAIDLQGVATEVPDYARLSTQPTYYAQHYSSYNYGLFGQGYTSSSSGGGMPGNFGSGCSIDGAAAACGIVMGMVNSGAAVPCPANNCGPRYNPGGYGPNGQYTPPGFEIFRAYASGQSGYHAINGVMGSDGRVFVPTPGEKKTGPDEEEGVVKIWINEQVKGYYIDLPVFIGYRGIFMLGMAAPSGFLLGRYDGFSEGERTQLREAFSRVNSKKCHDFFDGVLTDLRKKGELKSPPFRATLKSILGNTTLNRYNPDIEYFQVGVAKDRWQNTRDRFDSGAIYARYMGNGRVFLGEMTFYKPDYWAGFIRRDTDTAGVITHELFHAAGLNHDQIYPIHDEIQKNCGDASKFLAPRPE